MTSIWNSIPWGSGTAGEDPSVGGDVYPYSVEFITSRFVRLNLNTKVIVNSLYLNPANYKIIVKAGSPLTGVNVEVIRVLPPENDILTANYVYLETTEHTLGSQYQVGFQLLTTLDGVGNSSLSLLFFPDVIIEEETPEDLLGEDLDPLLIEFDEQFPASYTARTSKTMMMLKSLPSHFDRRIDALIFNVIAAVSLEDDKIGGSRSDNFPR